MKRNSRFRRLLPCLLIAACCTALPVSAALFDTQQAPQSVTVAALQRGDNLPPIAENLEISTYKNVAIQGFFAAMDPDGDPVTFHVTKNPARGELMFHGEDPTQFTYTPYENKTGKDSFTYVAEDNQGNRSQEATVKIKIEKQSTKVTYADLNGHPAHKAALSMAEEGVLVGERMGRSYFFHPDATVSREEFLALAMDALDLEVMDQVSVTGFTDDEAISTWAKPYVASALQAGMIEGSHNDLGQAVFQPNSTITQAEAAVLLDRLLSLSDITAQLPTFAQNAAPAWAYQSVVNLETAGVLGATASPQTTLTRPRRP